MALKPPNAKECNPATAYRLACGTLEKLQLPTNSGKTFKGNGQTVKEQPQWVIVLNKPLIEITRLIIQIMATLIRQGPSLDCSIPKPLA